MKIYLDYAAATPVDSRVIAAMEPFYTEQFYNPSALYSGAREVRSALEKARSSVAQQLGARSSEIIFTAGGTESVNLAIRGIMEGYPESNMIVSSIEHEAVLQPAKLYSHKLIEVDSHGCVIGSGIEKLIDDSTVLISVMYANNEIGSVQPIKDIVEVVRKVRDQRKVAHNTIPLYVHTDACQAPMYLDINMARLGVDMMSLNGGKMHGPKQSGVLYRKSSVQLKPLILGGGQEWGVRSGTENVAFAIGFAKALSLSEAGKSERVKQVTNLRDYFIEQLENRFDGQLNGHKSLRLANNIHVTFPGVDSERVLMALDYKGIAAAAGSACQASNEASSHVLSAIGRSESDAQSSIRFSIGNKTTKDEIDTTLLALESALKA